MSQSKYASVLKALPVGRVLLACFGVVVVIAGYLFVPSELAERAVRYGAYWPILLAFIGFAACICCLIRSELARLAELASKLGLGFGICFLICVGLSFVHVEIGPKILMDDAILESTAKSLHQSREVYTSTFGRWVANDFTIFDGYVDKRPLLYPFAVSLLHDLSGYRSSNPYIVNVIGGVCLLFTLSLLGYFLNGRKGAYLMLLLWVSLPLLSQNASGSGMDLINLLFLVGVILLSILYWKRLDAVSESALALAGVLLAQGRYESPLFLLPIAGVIVFGWIRKGEVILSAGTICAAPLLFGLALQNKFFSQSEALWELHSGTQTPFALENISDNFVRALSFYFNTSDAYANSLWIALLGFPAVVFLVLYYVRGWRAVYAEKPAQSIFGLFSAFLLAHILVILCYHDGQLNRLFASRFALPSYLLMSSAIIIVLGAFTRSRRVWAGFSACTLIFIVGYTLPMNAKGVFTQRNYVANEIEWMQSIADDQFEARSLVIDLYTIPWTLRQTASLSPLQAFSNAVRLYDDFASGKYTSIYLIERNEYSIVENKVQRHESLYPVGVFAVELLAQRSFEPYKQTTIYKVTGIDRTAAEELLK